MPAISYDSSLDERIDTVKKSSSSHGVDEILCVTKILEANNIPCCCVRVSALKYYGASRMRLDWEICVPTELVSETLEVLQSPPHANTYISIDRISPSRVFSVIHTYARFRIQDLSHTFVVVPAGDVLIDCQPNNIVYSLRGLPYPKLEVFAQSCLEKRNEVELCDLIDGANLSEEWGEENLNLEGTHNTEWAWAMKRKSNEWSMKMEGKSSYLDLWPTRSKEKRLIWQSQVRTKADRLDWSRPPEFFMTQYRLHNSPDPWTQVSNIS